MINIGTMRRLVVFVAMVVVLVPWVYNMSSIGECRGMEGYDADLNEYTGPAGECRDINAEQLPHIFLMQVALVAGLVCFGLVYETYLYRLWTRHHNGGHGQ